MSKQIIYRCDWFDPNVGACEEPARHRLLYQPLETMPPTTLDWQELAARPLRDYCDKHARAATATFDGDWLERVEVPA